MRSDRQKKRRDIQPVWAGSLPGRTEVAIDAGRSFVMTHHVEDGPWMVYVLLADDESVLYVGRTKNGNYRMRQHAADKSWWDEVDRAVWEPQISRRMAAIREAELIQHLLPRYNVALNPSV